MNIFHNYELELSCPFFGPALDHNLFLGEEFHRIHTLPVHIANNSLAVEQNELIGMYEVRIDAVAILQPEFQLAEGKIVNLLLEEWDEQRGIKRLSNYSSFEIDRKLEFLCRISYELTVEYAT